MASGQTKKKTTSGITNESRRNGKAWKVRPCGQRHGLTQCKPCALKAEAEKNASAQRKVRKAEKKAAEMVSKKAAKKSPPKPGVPKRRTAKKAVAKP